MFPLAVWISARCETRIPPPPMAMHFHHRHSSPKLHICSLLLVGLHDKLLLGLLSKISTRQREWLKRGGKARRELGIQTKPAEPLQTKKRDKFFSRCWQTQKKSFKLQMAVSWKQQRAPQRSPGARTCPSLCAFAAFTDFFLLVLKKEED